MGRPTMEGKIEVGKFAPAKPHLTNCNEKQSISVCNRRVDTINASTMKEKDTSQKWRMERRKDGGNYPGSIVTDHCLARHGCRNKYFLLLMNRLLTRGGECQSN